MDPLLAAVGASRSFPVQAAVALLCPRLFLRAFVASGLRDVPDGLRRPVVTLSFDVDWEADVHALPELTRVLVERNLRPGFAVCGTWVERFPDAHRPLVDAGFEIINHTHTHPNSDELCPDRKFPELSREEMRVEIERCHEAVVAETGATPRVFRAPHFGDLHREDVYPVLADLGYVAGSSRVLVRSPFGGWPVMVDAGGGRRIAEFPVGTCPRHPHSVLDTWHGLQRSRPWHAGEGEFVAVVAELLETGRRLGGYVNIYCDPAPVLALPDRDAFLDLFSADSGTELFGYAEMIEAGLVVDTDGASAYHGARRDGPRNGPPPEGDAK